MNCHEFRRHWMHDADNNDLSHIETCDDCLNWVEANFTSEEDIFMKEFPQPSAQLEERIMQAVYQLSTSQTVPPVSATMESAVPAAANRRFSRRYVQAAWAGAAAVVLAIGLAGVQMMNGSEMDTAQAPATAGSAAQVSKFSTKEADSPAPQATSASQYAITMQASPAEEKATVPDMNREGTEQTTVQKKEAYDTAVAIGKPDANPAAKETARQEQPAQKIAMGTLPAASAPGDSGNRALTARNSQPSVAAKEQKGDSKQADAQTPASLYGLVNPTALSDAAEQGKVNSLASNTEDENLSSALAAPTVNEADQQNSTAQITLSTFTDVETASHASDVPIPSIAKLPDGFVLTSVSLRYESETSQRVTHQSIMYQHNSYPIKIEVTRLPAGEHSLSVPGTFSETQVFQINGEQAIGVTYAAQSRAGAPSGAEHAVHFYTQKGNDTLYVVLSANSVTLSELIQLAKELTWISK